MLQFPGDVLLNGDEVEAFGNRSPHSHERDTTVFILGDDLVSDFVSRQTTCLAEVIQVRIHLSSLVVLDETQNTLFCGFEARKKTWEQSAFGGACGEMLA